MRPAGGIDEAALAQPATPAIVYDLPKLRRTAARLLELCRPFDGVACYSVKANRNDRVLAELAAAGLGADVASRHELDAARRAGFATLVATSPGLDPKTMQEIDACDGTIFFDSVEQVRGAADAGIDLDRHGVRLAMAGDYESFGLCPAAETDDLAASLGFRPHRLHVHAGEMPTRDALRRRLATVEPMVRAFHASTLDLGGGFGVLSNDAVELAGAFEDLHAFAERTRARLVFELGKVVVARCGVLVATVLARKQRGDRQVVVIDASPFNLGTWEGHTLRATTARGEPTVRTRVVGPTCYEGDAMAFGGRAPVLQVGDRVVFGLFGAYTASIAASLHGLGVPVEVFYDG